MHLILSWGGKKTALRLERASDTSFVRWRARLHPGLFPISKSLFLVILSRRKINWIFQSSIVWWTFFYFFCAFVCVGFFSFEMCASTLGDVPALCGTSADGWGSLTRWVGNSNTPGYPHWHKGWETSSRWSGFVEGPGHPHPCPLPWTPANALPHRDKGSEAFWTDRLTHVHGETLERFHSLKSKCCLI